MNQIICLKEDIIPGTNTLEGYRVVVYNPEIKQLGSWYTSSRTCELQFLDADPYNLEASLSKQGYHQVTLEFLLSDRFRYCSEKNVVISTTRRITDLMQKLIETPSAGLVKDVVALKMEHLLPDLEGEDRKDARVSLGDALENWFEEKVPDKQNVWYDFLRDTIEFIDWVLVAQSLDVGHWLYEPKFDNPLYDYANSLTWTVVHYIECGKFYSLKRLAQKFPEANSLADELQKWFIKQLCRSVTTRDPFAQLVLAGIHCVDWFDVAQSVIEAEASNT